MKKRKNSQYENSQVKNRQIYHRFRAPSLQVSNQNKNLCQHRVIGPKEFLSASQKVLDRTLILSVTKENKTQKETPLRKSLPHWFTHLFTTYIENDENNCEESWNMILDLYERLDYTSYSLSSRILHGLLIQGILQNSVPSIQSKCVTLVQLSFFSTHPSQIRPILLETLTTRSPGSHLDKIEQTEFFINLIQSSFSSSGALILLETLLFFFDKDDFYISYLFDISSSSPIRLNDSVQKVIAFYVMALQELKGSLLTTLRRLVSLIAYRIANHEYEAKNDDSLSFRNRGKNDFAKMICTLLPEIFYRRELLLLEPNWLSCLLSFHLLGAQGWTKTSQEDFSLRSILNSLTSKSHHSKIKSHRKTNMYGENRLHIACKKGNLIRVREILRSGNVNINERDHYGWTSFHEACAFGHTSIVQELLASSDLDVLATAGEENVTGLHESVAYNHIEVVKLILNYAKTKEEEEEYLCKLLKMKTKTGKTVFELATSETMIHVLKDFSSSGTILFSYLYPQHYQTLVSNFFSKYISTFGLHVLRDEMKRHVGQKGSHCWKLISSKREKKPRQSFILFRSQENAVKDIRSFWRLKDFNLETRHEFRLLEKIIQNFV